MTTRLQTATPSYCHVQHRFFCGLLIAALVSLCLLCQTSFRVEQTTKRQRGIAISSKTFITVTLPKISVLEIMNNDTLAGDDDSMDKEQKPLTRASKKSALTSKSSSHQSATAPSTQMKARSESSHHYEQSHEFPLLETLVLPRNATSDQFSRTPTTTHPSDEHFIIGNVQILLDFAILGHAKTATSFLMKWFSTHPELQIPTDEVCDLVDHRPADLVRKLYLELPHNTPNATYQRGFKCPGHFSRTSLEYFQDYFPETRLIVGVRHPGEFKDEL
jgi:hypothetical protein